LTPERLSELTGVTELLARSRLIGGDATLVVHGGGNTSCKTTMADHLGRVRPVLVIKASGSDLRSLDETGVVALYLDDLQAARTHEAMDDEAMVRFLARCRADLGPRRPSIETLLHAFLPARHVDHVHADAICALTNHANAASTIREALGPDVAYLPYERPGFALSRAVAEHGGAEAVVLGHHGLVTWDDDSSVAYERMRAIVDRARIWLDRRARREARPRVARPIQPAALEALLLTLRGRLSREERRVLHVDADGRAFADRDDAQAIVAAGPATADHLLRIRANPMVLAGADVATAIDSAGARAREIWEVGAKGKDAPALRDTRPAVALVPGLGTVASARDEREARVIAEVAARSHSVAAAVIDAFGAAEPLSDRDLHDLEYWPLELAKLGASRGRDLDSRVYIVTGAASGIGRDIARLLAERGAHLALADRDGAGASATEQAIRAAGGAAFAVATDVTSEFEVDALVHATIARWGGIDGIVSNAGVAVTGRIEGLSLDDWSRSMSVNATSHFLLARRVLPALIAQGIGGSLVFVASKNAFSPGDSFGAYSVAKAAEVQLARILAIEGGRSGVRANVVSPDAVFGGSHLWDDGLREQRAAAHGIAPDQLETFYASRSLLGIPVRGEDVAEAVAFCLSDRSSRTTGCVITVDGGVAAAFPR
jgi:rhamnulose-1-phosphate aldolase/alcohol dehydrogenase